MLVINDEAHHTHDEGSEWNAVIGRLHEKTPITAQLDFSATPRFTKGSIWSRKVFESNKCVLNMIPCDNDFEKAFARFLENAPDIRAFSKLPQPFGFSIDYTDGGMNLRSYYPDFVAIDKKGAHWLIETKGMETTDVGHKDLAATHWCENATALTETKWKYVKVPQKAFEVLQPARLADLAALGRLECLRVSCSGDRTQGPSASLGMTEWGGEGSRSLRFASAPRCWGKFRARFLGAGGRGRPPYNFWGGIGSAGFICRRRRAWPGWWLR